MDFVRKYNTSVCDLNFREDFLVYRRDVDTVLEKETGGNKSSIADTYDRGRKLTKGKRYNDKGKNPPKGTFPIQNFKSMRVNNCAEDEKADNDGIPEEDWGYYQYQGGHLLSQVCNAEQVPQWN